LSHIQYYLNVLTSDETIVVDDRLSVVWRATMRWQDLKLKMADVAEQQVPVHLYMCLKCFPSW